MGAVRKLTDDEAELKRMYVRPAAGNRKIGAVIVDALEAEARVLGVKRLLLETALYSSRHCDVRACRVRADRALRRVRRFRRQLLHGQDFDVTSAALVSFRLGRADGVSVVAKRWREALVDLGFDVSTVAGDGPVDRLVPGLAIDAAVEPLVAEVKEALDGFDLVVVENLLTIPMNLAASRVVAEVLRGRPAILHHHDPPWQRPRFEAITELPPDDPSWRHVVINQLHAPRAARASRHRGGTYIAQRVRRRRAAR